MDALLHCFLKLLLFSVCTPVSMGQPTAQSSCPYADNNCDGLPHVILEHNFKINNLGTVVRDLLSWKEVIQSQHNKEIPTLKNKSLLHENRLTALNNESFSQKEEITALKNESFSQKEEITTLKNESFSQKKKITALKNESFSQKEEITALKNESFAQKEEITALKNESFSQKKEITALKNESFAQKEEITALKNVSFSHKDKITTLKNESFLQKEEMTALKNVSFSQKEEITTLKNESFSQKEEITALKNVSFSQKDEITALKNVSFSQKEEITALKNVSFSHKQQITALKNESFSQKQQITALNSVSSSQIQELAALHNDVKNLYKQIVAINESKQDIVPENCDDVYKFHDRRSGVYTISIRDAQQAVHQVPVYCDMETTTGGWTVFQRRQDGSVPFNKTWEEYKTGFGRLQSEFWLGNHWLSMMTASKTRYTLRVDLESFDNEARYTEYEDFKISNETEKYRLNIGSYSGTAGDGGKGLSYQNQMKFSTKGNDNDQYHYNCALGKGGGFWYKDCTLANMNGLYKHSGVSGGQSIYWFAWLSTTSLKHVEMKLKPLQ